MKKYKTLTSPQKSGKHRSIEEMAKELLAFQNQKTKRKEKDSSRIEENNKNNVK